MGDLTPRADGRAVTGKTRNSAARAAPASVTPETRRTDARDSSAGHDSRTSGHGHSGTPETTQTRARGSSAAHVSRSRATIAILGGTGDLGTGLAGRWARAGYPVVIGSRTLDKAEAALANLRRRQPTTTARAATNADAAQAADIVVLTVPAAHQIATLAGVQAHLAGKILVDVTVPLVPPKVGTVQLPAEGSAGKRAQEFLGDGVMVVAAFQNVAAHLLQQEVEIECDVLVAGNKRAARDKVIELAGAAGMTGWHAGPIDNAAAAEALTSVLIQINRRHPISHAGIKLVGQG